MMREMFAPPPRRTLSLKSGFTLQAIARKGVSPYGGVHAMAVSATGTNRWAVAWAGSSS